jgi:cell wall-associated NlpC family hydrolase
MPPRLAICLFALVVAVVLVAPAGQAETIAPLRGLELKSPARFVPPPRPVRLPLSQRAVRIARKQLGVPYVYGGASPSGFDCSGLVSWVYGRLGVSLPHNAAALYGVGRPVSRWKLRPGDLVFFSGLGHVGMYIGRNRMIHAPQSGRSVEVQSLSVRQGSIVGARRVA